MAHACVPVYFRQRLPEVDLAQDAILNILTHIESIPVQSEQDFCRYISAIVRNVVRNAVRQAKRKKRDVANTVSLSGTQASYISDARAIDPELAAELREAEHGFEMIHRRLLTESCEDDYLFVGWWRAKCPMTLLAKRWKLTTEAGYKKLKRHLDWAYEQGVKEGYWE